MSGEGEMRGRLFKVFLQGGVRRIRPVGVFVLPLDDSRRVISAPILVSLGDHRTAAVQVGEVFASALKVDATAVIVAHNHPSGDPTASVQDKILTDELMRLGATLGVEVLDHLIVAGDKWTSCTRR